MKVPERMTDVELVAELARIKEEKDFHLNEWELGFIRNLHGQNNLSVKQGAKAVDIITRYQQDRMRNE